MKFLPFFVLPLFLISSLPAQDSNTGGGSSGSTQTKPTPTDFYQNGVWNGAFKNGGRYLVKANQIIAVSKHEYVADGVARVVEINLSLSTQSHVRFYFLEPVKIEAGGALGAGQDALEKARSLVNEATGRVSPTLSDPRVVKTYPASTHAHTIEYVIKEEARLNSLFDSLESAFRDPNGRHFWRE